jgi:hypothetical protein
MFFLVALFSAFDVELPFAASLFEKLLAQRHGFVNGLAELLASLVLAKKLFAHEKHSYTKAVALYVLVMSLARANLLAVLNGIAAQGHSRAVAVTVLPFVLAQAFLYDLDRLRLWKELVRPFFYILLREPYGSL